MLSQLLLWMLYGIIGSYITALIHLIVAERKGYKALDWWEQHGSDIFKGYTRFQIALNVSFGLIIWPVRILEYIFVYIPDLYNHYEYKHH